MDIRQLLSIVRNQDVDYIYLVALFRSIAKSLVKIFVPTFLLNKGFGVKEIVIYYYLIQFFVWILSSLPTLRIVKWFGLKECFLIGIHFSILDMWLLFKMSTSSSLALLAVIGGVGDGFFWTAYHVYFVSSTRSHGDKSNRGKVLSFIKVISKIGSVIGPFIGATLLSIGRVTSLLVIASVLNTMSLIPLLMGTFNLKKYVEGDTSSQPLKGYNFENTIPILKDFVCLIAHGIERSMGTHLWHFFASLNLYDNNYTTIRDYNSIIILLSLVFTFFVGKLIDSKRGYTLAIGAVLNASVWGCRVYFKDVYFISLSSVLYGWSSNLLGVSFSASIYDKADNKDILDNILFQEVSVGIGYMLSWLSILWFTPNFNDHRLFFMGVIASLVQSVFLVKSWNVKTTHINKV